MKSNRLIISKDKNQNMQTTMKNQIATDSENADIATQMTLSFIINSTMQTHK